MPSPSSPPTRPHDPARRPCATALRSHISASSPGRHPRKLTADAWASRSAVRLCARRRVRGAEHGCGGNRPRRRAGEEGETRNAPAHGVRRGVSGRDARGQRPLRRLVPFGRTTEPTISLPVAVRRSAAALRAGVAGGLRRPGVAGALVAALVGGAVLRRGGIAATTGALATACTLARTALAGATAATAGTGARRALGTLATVARGALALGVGSLAGAAGASRPPERA